MQEGIPLKTQAEACTPVSSLSVTFLTGSKVISFGEPDPECKVTMAFATQRQCALKQGTPTGTNLVCKARCISHVAAPFISCHRWVLQQKYQ